jgi:hypothetical protein
VALSGEMKPMNLLHVQRQALLSSNKYAMVY